MTEIPLDNDRRIPGPVRANSCNGAQKVHPYRPILHSKCPTDSHAVPFLGNIETQQLLHRVDEVALRIRQLQSYHQYLVRVYEYLEHKRIIATLQTFSWSSSTYPFDKEVAAEEGISPCSRKTLPPS